MSLLLLLVLVVLVLAIGGRGSSTRLTGEPDVPWEDGS